MSLKSDGWIRMMATQHRMIEPFSEHRGGAGILSYGLSSYGYDMRLCDEFQIASKAGGAGEIDPKRFEPSLLKPFRGETCVIPANSFVLARSLEYFRIPHNILTITFGKSTYARSGLIINVTPFEPDWEGYGTLSISNTAPVPTRVYAGEGVAQLLFLEGEEARLTTYAQRKGRYQATQTIQHSKA